MTHLTSKIYPADIKIREKAIKKALKSGVIEYEVRLKIDTIIKYIRIKGQIIFDRDRNPLFEVASILDITKDKKLLYQLKESEQRFKTIANAAPITIWISNKDKDCTYINKNWLDYTGSTFEENLGTGWLQFVHEDDKDIAFKSYAEAINKQAPFFAEYRARRYDGSYFWFLNHGIPTFDKNGDFEGFIGSFGNIHKQREFRNELEQNVKERTSELMEANEELIKLNLNLEEFAYMASHDLKEPLRKIRMFNSLLIPNLEDKETVLKYNDKIERSAERMTDLINNILDYSRIEKSSVALESVDLDQVTREVISDLSILIEERDVKIEFDALGEIRGAPIRIYQLFSNFIRNSIKFNKKKPEIHITSSSIVHSELPEGLQANDKFTDFKKILFKDNGIGINMSKRDYIFKPFKRLNSSSEYTGTGIGLAICKRIIDLHEGYIDVESEEGKGASFSVYFPIR